jgi:uncharacterized membrane protein
MSYSLLLPVHIAGGLLGLLSGAAAMIFRKGSSRHVLAGKVFVASMLSMSAAAAYLAVLKQETPNILAGTLAFYMVLTAWLTARRKEGEISKLDWIALLIPLVGGTWVLMLGLEKLLSNTPPDDGVPLGMNFFVGSVMLLSAAGDIRMLARGGPFGDKRLVRHLWRMCFGLFIAAGSFFFGPSNRPLRLLSNLGLAKHLPPLLFSTSVYLILTILPFVLMIFWLIRVWFGNQIRAALRKLSLPWISGPVSPAAK